MEDGQAELTWVVGYVLRQIFPHHHKLNSDMITHLTTKAVGRKVFRFAAPMIWNSIPQNIGYYHPLALSNAVSKLTSFSTPASHVPHLAIRQRLWLEFAWICALYKFCNNNNNNNTKEAWRRATLLIWPMTLSSHYKNNMTQFHMKVYKLPNFLLQCNPRRNVSIVDENLVDIMCHGINIRIVVRVTKRFALARKVVKVTSSHWLGYQVFNKSVYCTPESSITYYLSHAFITTAGAVLRWRGGGAIAPKPQP